MFSFKKFQREDYARLALHDGGILAHDTGGGKGIALLVWPCLKLGLRPASTNAECRTKNAETKCAGVPPEGDSSFIIHPSSLEGLRPKGAVLIVAPGDLHQQIITEARDKFRATVTPIPDQKTFLKLLRHDPPEGPAVPRSVFRAPRLPDGFYIASYTQLATNGVEDFPETFDPKAVSWDLVREYHAARGTMLKGAYQLFHVAPDCSAAELQRAYQRNLSCYDSPKVREALDTAYDRLRHYHGPRSADFDNLSITQQETLRALCAAHLHKEHAENIGEERWMVPRNAEGIMKNAEATSAGTPPEGDSSFSIHHSSFPCERRIKCVWSPSLADLCVDTFDCVVVDEGVRMKGEDTLIGKGLRRLCPKYRLVLTATPIKNRLPDIFRLAWWAAGGRRLPHARFPYADDPADREAFAAEFLVTESLLEKEEQRRGNRKDRSLRAPRSAFRVGSGDSALRVPRSAFRVGSGDSALRAPRSAFRVKVTPQVCNIHRLWKLFGPVVLRRPKREFGEDIVPKIRHVVRVPMGKEQAAVYKYHLDASYEDSKGQTAIGAQLQALRIAAANPASTHLQAQSGNNCSALRAPRSALDYIPKLHAALDLIRQILARGEQVVVFSAFHDSLDALSGRLTQAGVRHAVLDGRVTQKRRGKVAAIFKQGPPTQLQVASCKLQVPAGDQEHDASDRPTGPLSGPREREGEGRGEVGQGAPATCNLQPATLLPVLLAGVESMSEGHSFDKCRNVILLCYSWAYDKFEQAINRIHRLTSQFPVNVYPIICQGTIDRRLESLIQEKGDAAELVLDGSLREEDSQEVNLFELLRAAQAEAADTGSLVDERDLERQWPALRAQLEQAAASWDLPKAEGRMKNEEVKNPKVGRVSPSAPEHTVAVTHPDGDSSFSIHHSSFQRNPFLARLRRPSTLNPQPSTSAQWRDTPLFAACA